MVSSRLTLATSLGAVLDNRPVEALFGVVGRLPDLVTPVLPPLAGLFAEADNDRFVSSFVDKPDVRAASAKAVVELLVKSDVVSTFKKSALY